MKKELMVLVVNTGSTAVKYKLFNFKGGEILAESFKIKDRREEKKEDKFLTKIKTLVRGHDFRVAFRIVHGGDIRGERILNQDLIRRIKKFTLFAPIHNKFALKKIAKLKRNFPKHFEEDRFLAFFDTEFHQTMPEDFYTYPIDLEFRKKYGIRKYGFHGLAVESVMEKVKDGFEKRGKKMPEKIIFAHLGGGSSLTAVKGGKSVANTMGLTPISGLMMITRAGDVDSDLDKILAIKMEKPLNFVSELLSNKSGFLGLTGSDDTREIIQKAKEETEKEEGKFLKEKLAFDIYLKQLTEKISGYAGLLGGLDLLVFSGGIGEGNSYLRKRVLENLHFLGLKKENLLAVQSEEEKLIFEKVKEEKAKKEIDC